MAEGLLRFKDVLKLDGFGPLDNPKPLAFEDMHVSDYMPGEDPQVNYRAYRRKRTIGCGEGGPVSESTEVESTDVEEALTTQQRLARSRLFKRLQPIIKLGRERAKRRIASKDKLLKRARKKAREAIYKKMTKDIPKSELTYARRKEIEKRLEKPAIQKRITQIAKRMFPKVRKAELEKKRGAKK